MKKIIKNIFFIRFGLIFIYKGGMLPVLSGIWLLLSGIWLLLSGSLVVWCNVAADNFFLLNFDKVPKLSI